MGKNFMYMRFTILIIAFFLNGCIPSSQAYSVTFTPSPILETATPTETQTPTAEPILTPTPFLPGSMVLKIDTLGKSIPWLPLDKTAIPKVDFIRFNTNKVPFNNALVRQAFAHTIDRRVVVEMAKKYGIVNAAPSTTLVPPETLGRDLYGDVGLTFDPQKARDLLTQAGYKNPSSFPAVAFYVSISSGDFPNRGTVLATTIADMWRTNLGVTIYVYTVSSGYSNQIAANPPDLFWITWEAEYNDPDNFLRTLFRTGSQYNFGGFSNSKFDNLVDRATISSDPADRQEIYIEAERLLCETEAALIPLYHRNYYLP